MEIYELVVLDSLICASWKSWQRAGSGRHGALIYGPALAANAGRGNVRGHCLQSPDVETSMNVALKSTGRRCFFRC